MAENFFGLTDTGKVRSNNEDTFIATRLDKSLVLASVIDGVGGYNGGEVAAAIAREQILDHLSETKENFVFAMIEAIRKANSAITAKKQEVKELDSMACVATLAVTDIPNNLFYYAHVGDTRLYLLRDGSLVKISKDHSFVGFLEDSGRISEREAMDHPKRNEINKALGFSSQIDADDSFIETGQSPFLPGDMLLLCSDGLTDMVDKGEITNIITQPIPLAEKAGKLIQAANKNGGHDNITVVLVQNDKKPQPQAATIPVVELKENTEPPPEVKKEYQNVTSAIKEKQQKPMPEKKSNLYAVIISILCLFFIGASVYYYLQWQKEINKSVTKPEAIAVTKEKSPRNSEEIKLQNAINMMKTDTLVLSDTSFKQPLIISDTLDISRAKFFIRVKGNLAIQADTAYNAPAFILKSGVRAAGFTNLKLKGFTAGIASGNIPLYLRNVEFSDCKTPVQKNYGLPSGRAVTEIFPAAALYADSVNKTVKPQNGSR
ncbi:serine/threonine-protein phosphatase [Mucilaginibacter terrenus]|uniref:Serine/threonine-protein phosphatase n=1 Tax=Mucilaginibacter terrenus TaxID=2482727 RepID=A0A3E2NU24_9SPHI|nr:protein phosphatase 2C domain-containing protein [Mucilaginibacter terrenus]RFZ84513.1 serine/threonine-protein phosphatase [Mucilaginibacter terrenus]